MRQVFERIVQNLCLKSRVVETDWRPSHPAKGSLLNEAAPQGEVKPRS